MKSRDWRNYLESQHRDHAKVLFTVTELANAAGTTRRAVNVELARLRRQGEIVKYAHGRYGLPRAVTVETLLAAIDSHAYITGSFALHTHSLITQMPTRITCMTDRYSPKGRERITPLGRFLLVCVRSRVYTPPEGGVVAGPIQALCDFVYLTRRAGGNPESIVTFRNLKELALTDRILRRYPKSVQQAVYELTVAESE